MFKSFRITKLFPYLIIVAVSGFILTRNINKPFIGHHDWNGVFYSDIARNYLKSGLIKTKLGQMTGPNSFYTHYPPLLTLIMALGFKIFNIKDIVARTIPLIFHILTLLNLYYLSRKLKFSKLASFSSLIIVFTPMIRYFSKMPSQEALMLFFSTLSVSFYLDLIKNPSSKNQFKYYFAVILNGLSGWAGYFIYPLISIHCFYKHRKIFKKTLISIYILIIIFCLHLLHTYILTGSIAGGGLINAFLYRLNLFPLLNKATPQMVKDFTWKAYLFQQRQWLTIYFTASLLFTVFISLFLKPDLIILIFLFWGLSYPVIFSNVVFIHEYFNIFFTPFLGLSTGFLINKLSKKNFYLALTIALVIFTAVAFERNKFVQALNQTQAHQLGYDLGNLINQIVPEKESAAVFSINYANHHNIFINFYADRKIFYTGYSQEQWSQFINDYWPEINHFFIVNTHKLDNQIIDQALATQSAVFKNYGEFNYYFLEKDKKLY